MLSNHEIETYYQNIPSEQLEIVMELRNLIFSVSPNATELIQWKGLSYFDGARGGTVSAGICQIFVAVDAVQLAFIHGIFLPDPEHLLEGSARYKRFVHIHNFDSAPWSALEALIRASASLDPRTQQFI